ncbi:MAG: S8 family serine peptidase [Gammaproteobacteria bacterium]|nr:S8 family serine peptidase [Gammaproteobacteria bacterium]
MRSHRRKLGYPFVFAAVLACLVGSADVAAQVGVPGVNPDVLRLPDANPGGRLGGLRDRVERDQRRLQRAVDGALEELAALPPDVIEVADETAGNTLRSFTAATAPDGSTIEKDVLVVLIDTAAANRLRVRGLRLIGQAELPVLGKTLLTLQSTGDYPLAAMAADLRRLNESARVDYNHLYDVAARVPVAEPAIEKASTPDASDNASANASETRLRPLRIGLIDSAVRADHEGLTGMEIVAQDFIAHTGARPDAHGTAVASIIASALNDVGENSAQLYAAAVFFAADGQAPGATTESLIGALAWLAEADVDVINMSLAGPENELLGSALQALGGRQLVVAAVGNNGPRGAPLYPAAYDDVIAVTAVSKKQRIYRYANRGEHVDFAALGVDVQVATPVTLATAGWREDSGTSLATPRVAVVVAQLSGRAGLDHDAVVATLQTRATDLGRRGHDNIYGHGLVRLSPESAVVD